ncbi:hypothetical protein B9Z55_028574 [Caenorhabditis nigoni]|uniref:Uncharacterized protein n=1 Tax=Caenorhabditis nigoni TaxID=1611254 RepID=A0A2G5SB00_9PELO|nr:hypothetical protein B9Z55_028574 [Caenorhabditis nigoni]
MNVRKNSPHHFSPLYAELSTDTQLKRQNAAYTSLEPMRIKILEVSSFKNAYHLQNHIAVKILKLTSKQTSVVDRIVDSDQLDGSEQIESPVHELEWKRLPMTGFSIYVTNLVQTFKKNGIHS